MGEFFNRVNEEANVGEAYNVSILPNGFCSVRVSND